MKPSWDDTFIDLMHVIAKRSDDPRTKVGCVIADDTKTLVAVGYNGAPRGIDNKLVSHADPPEEKYEYVEHADRNAIYNACRKGLSVLGCTMYLPWCPCAACARAIIQAGISEIVIERDTVQERWWASCNHAMKMLRQAGLSVRLPNDLGAVTKIAGEAEGSLTPLQIESIRGSTDRSKSGEPITITSLVDPEGNVVSSGKVGIDELWVVVRWCSCPEYHAHTKEKGCFESRVMRYTPEARINPKSILGPFFSSKEEAKEYAKKCDV